MILVLAGGDMIQAAAIRKGSVDEYIDKFELHVKRMES
jgi:hypothetical protein